MTLYRHYCEIKTHTNKNNITLHTDTANTNTDSLLTLSHLHPALSRCTRKAEHNDLHNRSITSAEGAIGAGCLIVSAHALKA